MRSRRKLVLRWQEWVSESPRDQIREKVNSKCEFFSPGISHQLINIFYLKSFFEKDDVHWVRRWGKEEKKKHFSSPREIIFRKFSGLRENLSCHTYSDHLQATSGLIRIFFSLVYIFDWFSRLKRAGNEKWLNSV